MRQLQFFLTVVLLVLLACFPSIAPVAAQEPGAAKPPEAVGVYRVKIAVHELDNNTRVNTRNYAFLLQDGRSGRVRVGSRVPVQVAPGSMQYMDVGLKLDCTLREQGSDLLLGVELEVSDFATPRKEGEVTGQPVLRHASSEVSTVVRAGEPTIVTTLDDAASKRRYEVEVTATKVK